MLHLQDTGNTIHECLLRCCKVRVVGWMITCQTSVSCTLGCGANDIVTDAVLEEHDEGGECLARHMGVRVTQELKWSRE